ncbi:MAG: hypothetical protein HW416_3040 [Chloroflexi bacterium]|nr:hypothetical protein [Chloroflexota bacterium]
MTPLVALILVGVSLFVIAFPLWSRRSDLAVSGEIDSTAELEERYRSALADLQDLETDREVGNLSESDYAELHEQHRRRAAQTLRAIDVQRLRRDERRAQVEQEVARRVLGQTAASLASRPLSNGRVTVAATRTEARSPNPVEVSVTTAQPISRRVLAIAGGGATMAIVGIAALYVHLLQLQAAQAPMTVLPIQHAHAAVIDAAGTFWVGHHDGLLRSGNGREWQSVGLAGDVMGVTEVLNGSRRLAIGHDVLLASDDNGVSWTALTSDLPGTDIHGAGTGGNGIYAYVVGFGTFVSQNGSAWQRTGPVLSPGVTSLAVLPSRGGDLLVVASDGSILRSGDGGRTWGSGAGAGNLAITGSVRGVSADATTGALFAATTDGLFRSLSSAADWSKLPFKGGVTAVGARGDRVALVDDGGRFFLSTDGGGTWTADQ